MIHPFQPKISHNWHKHTDGLEHVRQTSLAAGCSHRRTQQVVKPENVHDIEILQPRAAVTLDRRIPANSTVAEPCRYINGLHAIFFAPPAKGGSLRRDFG